MNSDLEPSRAGRWAGPELRKEGEIHLGTAPPRSPRPCLQAQDSLTDGVPFHVWTEQAEGEHLSPSKPRLKGRESKRDTRRN